MDRPSLQLRRAATVRSVPPALLPLSAPPAASPPLPGDAPPRRGTPTLQAPRRALDSGRGCTGARGRRGQDSCAGFGPAPTATQRRRDHRKEKPRVGLEPRGAMMSTPGRGAHPRFLPARGDPEAVPGARGRPLGWAGAALGGGDPAARFFPPHFLVSPVAYAAPLFPRTDCGAPRAGSGRCWCTRGCGHGSPRAFSAEAAQPPSSAARDPAPRPAPDGVSDRDAACRGRAEIPWPAPGTPAGMLIQLLGPCFRRPLAPDRPQNLKNQIVMHL